jgi:hypothetical protein
LHGILLWVEFLPCSYALSAQKSSKFCRSKKLIFKSICSDPDFSQPIDDFEWRPRLFDDLLEKMRIAEPAGRKGLNDYGMGKSMNSIQKAVGQFRLKHDKKSGIKETYNVANLQNRSTNMMTVYSRIPSR